MMKHLDDPLDNHLAKFECQISLRTLPLIYSHRKRALSAQRTLAPAAAKGRFSFLVCDERFGMKHGR